MSRRRAALRVAGLLALLAAAAYAAAVGLFHPAWLFYERDFDASTRQLSPSFAAIMDADPGLRATMLAETRRAYDLGGWPAATARYNALQWEQVMAYADDQPVLDCAASWDADELAMLRSPAGCAATLSQDFSAPEVQPLLARSRPACNAAFQDGGRRRRQGLPPRVLSDDEYRQLFARLSVSPNPLTPEERAATQGTPANAQLFCSGELKFKANQAALPPGIAARYLRT